jgi:hypothetical protein
MSTTFFDSRKNTLKRAISGTVAMAAPSVSAYSGQLYVTNLTLPHGLDVPAGKAPLFRYNYEPFKDGIVWPPLCAKADGDSANPLNTLVRGPGIIGWADETNLYLQLFSSGFGALFTGTYNVHYVVYRDFYL